MGVEELGLTLETSTSILMKEKVLKLGEKFILATGIRLEVPRKNEHITNRTVTKATFHKESLNARLRILMISIIANLLQWYNLYLA